MTKTFLLVIFLMLLNFNANAKVTPLVDWQAELTKRANDTIQNTITSEEKCPEYSITTTYCYGYGEVLESCPEEGCSYYNRCVPEK